MHTYTYTEGLLGFSGNSSVAFANKEIYMIDISTIYRKSQIG